MSLLMSYWPSSKHGSIIVTSRNSFPGKDALATKGLHLKTFNVDQGAEFILSFLDVLAAPTQLDKEAALAISRCYDGLPLGLRQAAYFMRSKKCMPTTFLDLYTQGHNEIEQLRIPGYTKTVADVWEMSVNTLTQDAADLLDILTFLDPDAIPFSLFKTHDHASAFTGFLENEMRYLNATERLAAQSLIDINLRDHTLSLHRFFQETTFRRLKLRKARFEQIYCIAVEMVDRAVPEDDYLSMKHLAAWETVETYLGHAEILYARSSEGIPTAAVDSLLDLSGKIAG